VNHTRIGRPVTQPSSNAKLASRAQNRKVVSFGAFFFLCVRAHERGGQSVGSTAALLPRATFQVRVSNIPRGPDVPVVRVLVLYHSLPGWAGQKERALRRLWCTNGLANWFARCAVERRDHVAPPKYLHNSKFSSPSPSHIPNWLLGAQTSPRAEVMPEDVWGDAVRVHLTRLW
jgi:hypothetical protein